MVNTFYLMYELQLGLIIAVALSFCAILLGFTLLKKSDDTAEDNLGYLEHICIFDEGGEYYEEI